MTSPIDTTAEALTAPYAGPATKLPRGHVHGSTQGTINALRTQVAEYAEAILRRDERIAALESRVRALEGAARDACREAMRLARVVEG